MQSTVWENPNKKVEKTNKRHGYAFEVTRFRELLQTSFTWSMQVHRLAVQAMRFVQPWSGCNMRTEERSSRNTCRDIQACQKHAYIFNVLGVSLPCTPWVGAMTRLSLQPDTWNGSMLTFSVDHKLIQITFTTRKPRRRCALSWLMSNYDRLYRHTP